MNDRRPSQQGTVFGDLMSQLGALRLPDPRCARISQSTLKGLLEVMRQRDSIHRKAGSVHGCALFSGAHSDSAVFDSPVFAGAANVRGSPTRRRC